MPSCWPSARPVPRRARSGSTAPTSTSRSSRARCARRPSRLPASAASTSAPATPRAGASSTARAFSASRPATTRRKSTAGSRSGGPESSCGAFSRAAVERALGGSGAFGRQLLGGADRDQAVALVELLQMVPVPQDGAVDPAVGALGVGHAAGARAADELGGGGNLQPVDDEVEVGRFVVARSVGELGRRLGIAAHKLVEERGDG